MPNARNQIWNYFTFYFWIMVWGKSTEIFSSEIPTSFTDTHTVFSLYGRHSDSTSLCDNGEGHIIIIIISSIKHPCVEGLQLC